MYCVGRRNSGSEKRKDYFNRTVSSLTYDSNGRVIGTEIRRARR